MAVVPAVLLGLGVVFFAGYFLTAAVVVLITEWRKAAPSEWWDNSEEKTLTRIAVIGGVIAVALLVLIMIKASSETTKKIWIGLTILGVVGGLLTFFMNQTETKSQPRVKYRPRASTSVPPPGPEDQYRPPPSTKVPSPPQEDPYRALLAKAMYDQSLVDRLIERERKYMPYASLDDLCRSAIARLERNNG
jgi:hypothetical protein